MSELIKAIAELLADLISGRKSEDEAREICARLGRTITETDSDRELEEYERHGE